jgi:hypothetical protein
MIVSEPRLITLRRLVLILLPLLLVALSSTQFFHTALAQTSGQTVLYVSPASSSVNFTRTQSVSVNVDLNLSRTDSIAGYDIYMSYNDTLLNATSITPGNLFPPSERDNATYCINDLGYNCSGLDGPGVVHLANDYIPGALSGPMSWTVFTVQFSVLGIGHSFLQLFNDTIYGPLQPSGNVPVVTHLTWHGVFSDDGLQAFFNVAPAVLIVNNPVYFDASPTFNPQNLSASYRSALSYSWDFGDHQTGSGVTASETYPTAGTYTVNLFVADPTGATSKIHRPITISADLGGLRISVKDTHGNDILQNVTLSLFRGSILVETITRQAGITAPFSISGLTPGLYRLDFSGPSITPASKQENVLAGLTQTDIVILTVQTQPTQTVAPDPWIYFLEGSSIVILGGGAVSIIYERRKKRRK